jgi:hypothetical protein
MQNYFLMKGAIFMPTKCGNTLQNVEMFCKVEKLRKTQRHWTQNETRISPVNVI